MKDEQNKTAEVEVECSDKTAALKEGDRIDFDNGGSVVVHWVSEAEVGFSVSHPKWDENRLLRMTHADFAVGLVETRKNIANAGR